MFVTCFPLIGWESGKVDVMYTFSSSSSPSVRFASVPYSVDTLHHKLHQYSKGILWKYKNWLGIDSLPRFWNTLHHYMSGAEILLLKIKQIHSREIFHQNYKKILRCKTFKKILSAVIHHQIRHCHPLTLCHIRDEMQQHHCNDG